MTLDDVYAALRDSLAGAPPNQTIDLVAASARPPLAGLAPLLAQLRIAGTWTLSGAAVARRRDDVLLTGDGGFALPGATAPPVPVAVTLTATAPTATTVAFELALAVGAPGWTLARTFSTPQAPLPATLALDEERQTLRWMPRSAIAEAAVDGATITARSGAPALALSGWLTQRGPLAGWADWVGPWPLRLGGTVTLAADATTPPQFELTAISPTSELTLGPLSLRDLGFGLRSLTGLDPELSQRTGFSELDVRGTVRLGDAIAVHLRTPLLVSATSWHLTAEIEHPPPLSGGLAAIGALFDLPPETLTVPPGLSGFDSFRLTDVDAVVRRDADSGLPTELISLAVTIASPEPWRPPIPGLRLTDVGTRWLLAWATFDDGVEPVVSGSVFGSIVFGAGEQAPTLDLLAALPQFVLTGSLREDTPIRLDEVFRTLLGDGGPSGEGREVTGLGMLADPAGQTYGATADVTTRWPLPFFSGLELTSVSLWILVTQSRVSGGVEGLLTLTQAGGRPALRLSAEYVARRAGGWRFAGHLEGHARPTVADLVALIVGSPPAPLAAITVERLDAVLDTGTETWSLDGALAARFDLSILDTQVRIEAGAAVALSRPAGGSPHGRVSGRFAVNRLALGFAADVGVPDPTYALTVYLGDLFLQATIAWKAAHDGVPKHRVVTLQLGGSTLGELLEQLVRLAAPTLDFRLEPPWDVLKRIDLSRFTLTIDATERLIEMRYAVDADLVLLYVEAVGIRYRLDGENRVELIVEGSLMGQRFSGPDALRWDVVRDPPPEVPGKGPALLELRYLALGQRIRLPDPQPDTVASAIARLRREMEPRPGTDVDPLAGSPIVFDAASGWLAALDMTVMGTVELALVFSDPNVYGLSVGLHGERAGPLAGLRFEILYKRLGDGIGMFRVELALPEAFRHIELGEISLTLGVVVVEVYTNGNFLIDLGFPHERSFDRSFGVQVFPFVGRGGIYLGVLNGTTSRRVPAIVGGSFSPVLELGVGLAIGVGKDVTIGPLSGGVYVQVEVIFQGVLAWYESQGGGDSARYHWAQGVAAIHGRLYGEVDFAVVKASVSLEAYAQVSVTFESCRATTFALEVRVEAEAEIEILWVSVSFSFEVEYDASFTVGSDSPTPWTLAHGPAARAGGRGELLRPAPRRLLAAQRSAAAQAQQLAAGDAIGSWNGGTPVFGGDRRRVAASLLPLFTLADPPLVWGRPTAGGAAASRAGDDAPAWRIAFTLFARDGSAPGARTAAQAAAPAPAPADPPAPAAILIEALLRWSLSTVAGGEPGKVTAGQLALLGEQLADPAVTGPAFALGNLKRFFATNLVLELTGDVDRSPPAGAMALPLPPFLTLAVSSAEHPSDLTAVNPVGALYAEGAAAYMAAFSPAPSAPGGAPDDDPGTYTSFAAHVFCDWCLMATREAVRTAARTLARRTVTADGRSLDELAADPALFPRDAIAYTVRAGDTVASVAAALGATVAELEQLNPALAAQLADAAAGTVLTVVVGVTGATLAEQNATVALAPRTTVTIDDVRIQARAGDSLASLSARVYGAADAARLVADGALHDKRVLLAGATVPVPARTDPLPGVGDPALVAGVLYVRCFGDTGAPLTEWYAQAVADLNVTALQPFGPGVALPAGLRLTVPAAPMSAATTTYATVAGDSLLRIGAALSLAQSPAAYADPRWQAFRAAVRGSGGSVTVPATAVAVLGGETLDLLAARLVADAATLLGWSASAPLLAPLATIVLARLQLSTTQQPTIAALAAAAGLTVAALAARPELTGLAGLVATGTPLTLAQLPAQSVETLVAETCAGRNLTDVSHQLSRNLLAGTRLPAPQQTRDRHVAATGPLTGLAQLTGQQLPAPPLDGTTALTATVTVSPGVAPPLDWLVLDPRGLRPGTISYSYANEQLRARYPAPELHVTPTAPGPRALPVAGDVPRTYGLDQRVDVQAATPLPIPGAAADSAHGPTLWPLPAALLAKARAGSATPFELLRAPHDVGDVARHEPVGASTFATHVALTLRRVPGRDGLYELLDADAPDRDLILGLSRAAHDDPPAPAARMALFLALAPVPGAADPSGLALLAADPQATFAVRTDTATDVPLRAPPTVLSAPLASTSDFLRLLWEGSGTRPATCLAFATTQDEDLPPGAFAEDGTVVLWLLAVDRRQQAPAPNGRTLLPTDTCALVGPGLDALRHALYVETHDPSAHPQELLHQAILPPGSAGVTLTIPRPSAPVSSDDPAQALLAQRFSLLTTRLSGTYAPARVAPPLPPLRDDGSELPLWRRRRLARAERLAGTRRADPEPVGLWRYEQVVPVASFGPPSVAPAVTGLPRPGDDPYRGFGAARALATASFSLAFADVLGNVTTEDPQMRPATATMGYTDPLLGVRAWPATTTSWSVARSGADVLLRVDVVAQPGAAMPAPGAAPAAAAEIAGQQAKRLAEAYFQLSQPTLSGALLSPLAPGRDGLPLPLALREGTTPLWRYVAGATLYANAAAALAPVPLAGLATLADVSAAYGVGAAALAAVNGGARIGALVRAGQPLQATASAETELGDSAETLLARVPEGWPRPSATTLLTDNASGPALRPGAVLAVPAFTVAVGPDAPRTTLAALAAAHATTPAQLALDAAAAPALADGFTFTAGGSTVVAGGAVRSFETVRAAFGQLCVQVALGELADGAADREGIFAADAVLPLAHAVAGPASTLAALAGGAAVGAVAAANVALRDLYPAGTTLSLGAWPVPPPVPSGAETLAELAQRLGTTPAALLAANPALALADDSALIVPGATVLPADPVQVPYALGAGDTLTLVAPRFATAVAALADGNRMLPGLLSAGTVVAVVSDDRRYETTATAADSLDSVWQRLHDQHAAIDFPAVVSALATTTLAPGALLVCPPAALAAAATAAQVSAAYGVEPLAFAQANAALAGVLAPAVRLTAPSGEAETTTARDTLNAVLGRFAARGVTVDLAGLLAANAPVALYAGGARALLPPPPARVSASLGAAAGPFAQPAFPLVTTLRLERDAAVVDPSLQTPGRDGPVERDDAVVPAPSSADGGAARTLDAFVQECLTALPALRLATAKVRGEAADVWAVDFGPGGIAAVALDAPVTYPGRPGRAPRTLALRPLYGTPQSRSEVAVPALAADGSLGPATPMSFDGADVETWARRLLADLDLFAAPASAAGIYAEAAARPDLETLLRLRWRLSQALARGLAPVLVGTDARAADGAAAAAETLARACGASLASAYDVTLAVQYDTTASTPYPAPPAPTARLHGTIRGGDAPGTEATFSGASAPLLPAPSFTTVLLTVADPAGQAEVDPGRLGFAADALELDVHALDGTDGAQTGAWLSFVRPLTGDYATPALSGDLGAPALPIPLRTLPQPPLLVEQSGTATHAGEHPSLAQAGQWTFSVVYAHEHAAQDELLLRASFNVPGPPAARADATGGDLAAELWRWVALADRLREQMAVYAQGPGAPDPAGVRAHVAHSVVTLLDPIVTAWEGHWAARDAAAAAAQAAAADADDYDFRVRIAWRPGPDPLLQSVTLTLANPLARPSPTGVWPELAWREPDGSFSALVPDPSGPHDGSLVFTPASATPRSGTPTLRVAWGGLNVAATQNGQVELSVRRNAQLLPGVATSAPFVMATATVSAADVTTPVLSWTEELGADGSDLTDALRRALTALFGDVTGPPLTIQLAYGHELIAPDPDVEGSGIRSWLPVALYPHQPLSAALADEVGRAAAGWLADFRPSPAGAAWALSLTLSSSLARRDSRPLLVLDRLVYVLPAG